MTHAQKIKLARQHITHSELIRRVSIFDTAWWKAEKLRIVRRTTKRNLRYKKVI